LKDIVIYGAGGFGRETALLIHQINQHTSAWNLIGFYDDGLAKGKSVDSWKVLGGIDDLIKSGGQVSIVIAIADPITRKLLIEKLNNIPLDFPTLIHPLCQRGDKNNYFGKGCVLTAGVILTTSISFEDFVIVNLLSTIGHDVVIGKFSTVMPGCSISGSVKIGECSLIGTGARILQNLSIGKKSRVGAGAVVTQSFPDGQTILGIPAYAK